MGKRLVGNVIYISIYVYIYNIYHYNYILYTYNPDIYIYNVYNPVIKMKYSYLW